MSPTKAVKQLLDEVRETITDEETKLAVEPSLRRLLSIAKPVVQIQQVETVKPDPKDREKIEHLSHELDKRNREIERLKREKIRLESELADAKILPVDLCDIAHRYIKQHGGSFENFFRVSAIMLASACQRMAKDALHKLTGIPESEFGEGAKEIIDDVSGVLVGEIGPWNKEVFSPNNVARVVQNSVHKITKEKMLKPEVFHSWLRSGAR
jgi:hypothetical protein